MVQRFTLVATLLRGFGRRDFSSRAGTSKHYLTCKPQSSPSLRSYTPSTVPKLQQARISTVPGLFPHANATIFSLPGVAGCSGFVLASVRLGRSCRVLPFCMVVRHLRRLALPRPCLVCQTPRFSGLDVFAWSLASSGERRSVLGR